MKLSYTCVCERGEGGREGARQIDRGGEGEGGGREGEKRELDSVRA